MPKFLEVSNRRLARKAINQTEINVLDFISNPADTSTHQAGFEAAISAALSGAGTHIIIPAGDWHVGNLLIPGRAPLKFSGQSKALLPQTSQLTAQSITKETVLRRTGNNPLFKLYGLESESMTSPNWWGYVRDVLFEDICFLDGTPTATTPMMDIKGATMCHFNRVSWSAVGATAAPLLSALCLHDSRFVDCHFMGGGNVGVPQIWLRGSTGVNYRETKETCFVNTQNVNSFGPGLWIGDPADTQGPNYLVPSQLSFVNHKFECITTEPTVTVHRGNGLMFSNFYISHYNSATVMDIVRGFGIFGDIAFGQIEGSGAVYPTERLKLGQVVFDVGLDLNIFAGLESTPNVVTSALAPSPSVNITINNATKLWNGKACEQRFIDAGLVSQTATADNFECSYLFSKTGLNRWKVGTPSNPFGDQQQFSITALDSQNISSTIFRLRSFDHTSGTDPSTATYRDLALNGFLNLTSTALGWVNFQNLTAPPSAPVGGYRLYASGNKLTIDGNAIETQNNKNVADGYCGLDASGLIPVERLPISAMTYLGAWNASTNTPSLANGTGTTGDVYRVSVGATRDLGAGSDTYAVGDWVIYNGTVWERVDNNDAVTSVNGATGVVTIDKAGVGLSNVDNTSDATKNAAAVTLTNKTISGSNNTLSNIGNSSLTNSGITIAGTSTALGGTISRDTITGLSTNGLVTRTAANTLAIATAGTDYLTPVDDGLDLDAGEATMQRQFVNATNLSPGNQALRLTYFTARRTEQVNTVRFVCAVAGVGTTVARIGLYTVAGNGDLALVASTANDTNLFASTGVVTKALSAAYTKTRGTRYAVGVLWQGTTTSPQVAGNAILNGDETAQAPRLSGAFAGQSDLPATVSAGSITNTAQQIYVAFIP